MNDWLYKNEDFEPSNNKYAHIDKSLSAFEKLLSKFKHINIGEKFRAIYFQNPLIKFILLITIIGTTAFTNNLFGIIYITLWLIYFLSLLDKKDIYKCVIFAMLVFIGNLIVLTPSIINNNYQSFYIISKAVLMVLTINIYVFSTKWNHITKVLKFFKVPDLFILLLDITLKYIINFSELAIEMLNALKVRIIGKTNYNSTGIVGTIFIKAKEQGEELYFTMECRGFTGEYVGFENFRIVKRDKKQVLIGSSFLIGYIIVEVMVKYF